MVGSAIPVEGPWVWLGDRRWVGCAAEVCGTRVEAVVVEGVVYGVVASSCDSEVELLVVVLLLLLLNLEDVVAGRAGLVVVVVGEAKASVICGLTVTGTGVVFREISVTSTAVSVRESSISDVLLPTVGGAVVRPGPTLASPVWDGSPSVPSWF